MAQQIFREKSINRVNSPEKLDEYLKVTSPSVWLIILGIIFVLVGFIFWGYYGQIKTTVNTACLVSDSNAYCYVLEEDYEKIKPEMVITINDFETKVSQIGMGVQQLNIEDLDYIKHILDASEEEYIMPVSAKCKLSDGIYKASIVIETISPIKFVLN